MAKLSDTPTQSLMDILESSGELPEGIAKGLNEQQREAVLSTAGPVLIIAGAGTGKTTVVTRRIAYLIESGLAKPSEILALTFTDKAAREMEERVDVMVPMGYVDAWILTFHAFGDRILREHALELGLSPDFKVMGKTEQILFLQQHLFELGLDYYRPLSNPTKFLEALVSFMSRCKDEDVTPADYQRYVDNVRTNFVFGGKEPGGRREEGGDSSKQQVASSKRRRHSERSEESLSAVDLNRDSSVLPQNDGEMGAKDSPTGLLAYSPTEFDYDSFEYDEGYIARQQELATAYATYERLKAEANVMDFGDQVARVLQLFRERPDVLKKYQQRFKYVLVDEFQDTNYAQNMLVQQLVGVHKNICVVGDDDQSIYKFRGAAISNILKFQEDFPEAKQVVLTQNYRSNQAILDASYRLIKHNDPDRLEVANNVNKKLVSPIKTGGTEPEELFGQTLSGEADAVVGKIEELMGERPELRYKDFAILVRANSQAEPFTQALNLRGLPFKFSGASGLYEREEVKVLISFLTALGNVTESMNLFHLAASELYQVPMRDLIAVMDWASGQHKSLHWALSRLDGLSESLEFSDDGRQRLGELRDEVEEFLELSRSEEVGRILFQFLDRRAYLKTLQKQVEQNYGQGLEAVEASTRLQNIQKFFDRIENFNRLYQQRSVRQFVDYLTLMREAGDDPVTADLDPDLDAVNVLTVHAAKGLEFSVVFMVNLVTERFPSRERAEAIELPEVLVKERLPQGDFHLQEERRLFYVGMTRAMDQLFLSWGRDYGGRRERKISPFVIEALGHPSAVQGATKLSAIERISRYAGQLSLPMGLQRAEVDVSGITLSPYKIDDYESCPLRFYFANVLRVPSPPNHALVYGKAAHAAVEEFYRCKQRHQTLALEQLISIYEDSWDSRGFLAEEHERLRFEHGTQVLTELWEREHDNPFAPKLLEKDFTVRVDDVVVKGRWDRLDEGEDGGVTILDYKTSEGVDQKKADRRAKESVQLKIYTLAYSQMYGKLPERVGLLFVDGNVFGSYQPTEKTLEEATSHVLTVAAGVKNGEFQATPSAMACEFCPFRDICPQAARG